MVVVAGAVEARHHNHPSAVAANTLVPEPDAYPTAHQAFLRLNQHEQPGLLFLGDSITDFWRYCPTIWSNHFARYRPANFGVIFDRIENVLWRVENGELEGIHPRVIVLLVGTNNLSTCSDEQIVVGLRGLVRVVHQKQPDARVLLLGIFPRHDVPLARVRGINQKLAGVDDVTFLDVGSVFLTPDGAVSPEFMPDGLHPSPAGFEQWAAALEPSLAQLYRAPSIRVAAVPQ